VVLVAIDQLSAALDARWEDRISGRTPAGTAGGQ
jgi:hypothetical protein